MRKIIQRHYLYIMARKPLYNSDTGQMMDKFLTMKEVAAYLRLSTQSVKRMIEDGRLAAHKIGPNSYRISELAVGELLTQTQSRTVVDGFAVALEDKKKEVVT